ncbi:MAG: HDOD domain-containing protein, partial [Gammaproteobacteria bacterium]
MDDKLDNWVVRISSLEIPIFKGTLNSVASLTSKYTTSSNELSRVILQDATLTARILRISNSYFYNPRGTKINTISSAVMFIGFNNVRDIAMSLAVIDALIKKQSRNYIIALMARSFHAAVQARDMAEKFGDPSSEEVFIASLLFHFGEMAFWCIQSKESDLLIESMEEEDYHPAKAQLKILGFKFNDLTAEISKNWHLGDLLVTALKNKNLNDASARTRHILLSQRLSDVALKGWETKETEAVLKEIAKHLDLSFKATKADAVDNAKKAVEVANNFGASLAAMLIPVPGVDEFKNKGHKKITKEIDDIHIDYPQADPILQLNVLRDLSNVLERKPDFNNIIGIVLEGMHRGIGMDRVLFAVLDKNTSSLNVKYILGIAIEKLESGFHIKTNEDEHSVFSWVIERSESV